MDKDNLLFKNGPWKALSHITGPLDKLGGAMSIYTLYEGLTQNDQGKITTGGIGTAAVKLPWPLNFAAGAALTYGELTLPTSNDEYAGTYDMALRNHFGSAYDPANPTQEQAAWGQQHYAGVGGFFNSISDGMDYKRDKIYSGIGNAWNGFTGLVSGR